MSAIQSLRTAVGTLSRRPVLVLGGLCYALLVLPQRALQLAGVPLAPAALQMLTFFLTPFVLAGVVGMAREALDGETGLDSLVALGKSNYVDLLLATMVELGIKLAFGVVLAVLGILVLVAGGGAGAVGGAALLVLIGVVYLAVLFLVQFYPVVVVLDDAGPVDAVTGSVAFVRANLLGTLGFSVVTVLLGGLAAIPITGVAAYRFVTAGTGPGGDTPGPIGGGMGPGGAGAANGTGAGTPALADAFASGAGGLGLSTPEVAALSLASLVTTALFVAFRLTYATAFYRRNGRSIEERVLDDGP